MNKLDKIIKVLSSKALLLEINQSNMEIFRKEIVPQIYERQVRFPRKKAKDDDFLKKRKYDLPPKKFMIGIYTGTTYTALVQGGVSKRELIITTTDKKNYISINTNPKPKRDIRVLNAVLYLNKEMKKKLIKNAKKIILEKIK